MTTNPKVRLVQRVRIEYSSAATLPVLHSEYFRQVFRSCYLYNSTPFTIVKAFLDLFQEPCSSGPWTLDGSIAPSSQVFRSCYLYSTLLTA